MSIRGYHFETSGRILYESDGEMILQIWMRTPDQPEMLLEVAGGRDEDDLWRRLHELAYVRALVVTEYRTERDERGGWEPIPFGPTPARDPATWKRGRLGEAQPSLENEAERARSEGAEQAPAKKPTSKQASSKKGEAPPPAE